MWGHTLGYSAAFLLEGVRILAETLVVQIAWAYRRLESTGNFVAIGLQSIPGGAKLCVVLLHCVTKAPCFDTPVGTNREGILAVYGLVF